MQGIIVAWSATLSIVVDLSCNRIILSCEATKRQHHQVKGVLTSGANPPPLPGQLVTVRRKANNHRGGLSFSSLWALRIVMPQSLGLLTNEGYQPRTSRVWRMYSHGQTATLLNAPVTLYAPYAIDFPLWVCPCNRKSFPCSEAEAEAEGSAMIHAAGLHHSGLGAQSAQACGLRVNHRGDEKQQLSLDRCCSCVCSSAGRTSMKFRHQACDEEIICS